MFQRKLGEFINLKIPFAHLPYELFRFSNHFPSRASEARLSGALSKGGKMRGVATNIYLWKTSEKTEGNRSKKKIPSSGVVLRKVDKSGALAPMYPPSKRKSDLRSSF
ncbi:hypothetical protein HKD37_04G010839 [Glycine soja]